MILESKKKELCYFYLVRKGGTHAKGAISFKMNKAAMRVSV